MINKKATKEIDDFEEPPRTYTDTELSDFHNKIQRFWGEPRILTQEVYGGKIAQKFNWEELAVAYGACRKVPHGLSQIYMYNQDGKRYRELDNIWKQYQYWTRRDDKKVEVLEKMASEIPF